MRFLGEVGEKASLGEDHGGHEDAGISPPLGGDAGDVQFYPVSSYSLAGWGYPCSWALSCAVWIAPPLDR